MTHKIMQLSFQIGRILRHKSWCEKLEREERKRQEKLKKQKGKK